MAGINFGDVNNALTLKISQVHSFIVLLDELLHIVLGFFYPMEA